MFNIHTVFKSPQKSWQKSYIQFSPSVTIADFGGSENPMADPLGSEDGVGIYPS